MSALTKLTTARELFGYIQAHSLRQNKKSEGPEQCLYREESVSGTLKCAVGCVIADEHYRHNFEGDTIDGSSGILTAIELSIERPLTNADIEVLTETQSIHDDSYVSEWEDELEYLHSKLFGQG